MFKHNRELFNKKATEMTTQHAQTNQVRPLKPLVEAAGSAGGGEEGDTLTQETEGPSQRRDSFSSDDSFSDGDSSSEEDVDGVAPSKDDAGSDEEGADPPIKRRRQT
ncbi:unnamed protein product [Phytophthora fragariaefolia]|uniref:Unnamed protein product n=1 Tax=Phytophthora fragariaefolia TaxID=1490495 RepID=A0A9W7CQR0_9STRA|nr:unnamed protein product [Phytophthora fragariaefolia]